MWRENLLRTVFTHYSPMGASRIDRIYRTKDLSDKKICVENVAASFTENLSVVISLTEPIVRLGKEFWKMNTCILSDEALTERLRQKRALCMRQRRFCTDWPMLWGRYRKQIILFCTQERTERRQDFVKMENFFHECIYDVLKNAYPHG